MLCTNITGTISCFVLTPRAQHHGHNVLFCAHVGWVGAHQARDEQYTAGKVQVHRDLGRVEWQEESEDEEEAMGLDMLLETKRQQHHQRFGNLALPGTKL
eukprot:3567575-Rhodomonas_salina.1